jgi:hypothetical protein
LFAGTVKSAKIWQLPLPQDTTGTGPLNLRWYVIDIERVWSGPAFERIAVYSPWSIAACGIDLAVGERILAEAHQRAPWPYEGKAELEALWRIGSCSVLDYDPADIAALDRSQPALELDSIADDDPRLSPPVLASPAPKGETSGHVHWLFWAFGGLVLACVATALLGRRRRRRQLPH